MTAPILITGGSARIGKVLAKGLAADGWPVVIHYNRSQTKAEALVKEIKAAGGTAAAIGANLTVPSELNTLIARASDAIGTPLTALINNASTFAQDSAQDFSRAGFDHHMDVNLFAALKLSQDFAAQIPEDANGAIINMIDQRVLNPSSEFFTYSVSKTGLFWATKTMAQALAPQIRVNGVGPGPTLQSVHQTEAEFARELNSTLLGTGSPPDTILQAVRYLLTATSVTGQMIAVDGGQHLNHPTP